ncbi:MAG: hypothetical protein HUU37_08490, partial [Bdellovibrionales bacterium]|nr:hypothetical protein [Bdellovibrionales bacterium]
RSAGRGRVDFTVRTRLPIRQLEARLKAAPWEGLEAEVARGDAAEVGAAGLVLLRLNPKAMEAAPEKEGGSR